MMLSVYIRLRQAAMLFPLMVFDFYGCKIAVYSWLNLITLRCTIKKYTTSFRRHILSSLSDNGLSDSVSIH